MFKNSFILVFRFHHNGSSTDVRYNALHDSLTKFIEENDGKEDKSTSTCIFYTTNDPIFLGKELIAHLYTSTTPYHVEDRIVIIYPEERPPFEDKLKVGYLSDNNGTPTLTQVSFLEYINGLAPKTKVFKTSTEELIDEINAKSLG